MDTYSVYMATKSPLPDNGTKNDTGLPLCGTGFFQRLFVERDNNGYESVIRKPYKAYPQRNLRELTPVEVSFAREHEFSREHVCQLPVTSDPKDIGYFVKREELFYPSLEGFNRLMAPAEISETVMLYRLYLKALPLLERKCAIDPSDHEKYLQTIAANNERAEQLSIRLPSETSSWNLKMVAPKLTDEIERTMSQTPMSPAERTYAEELLTFGLETVADEETIRELILKASSVAPNINCLLQILGVVFSLRFALALHREDIAKGGQGIAADFPNLAEETEKDILSGALHVRTKTVTEVITIPFAIALYNDSRGEMVFDPPNHFLHLLFVAYIVPTIIHESRHTYQFKHKSARTTFEVEGGAHNDSKRLTRIIESWLETHFPLNYGANTLEEMKNLASSFDETFAHLILQGVQCLGIEGDEYQREFERTKFQNMALSSWEIGGTRLFPKAVHAENLTFEEVYAPFNFDITVFGMRTRMRSYIGRLADEGEISTLKKILNKAKKKMSAYGNTNGEIVSALKLIRDPSKQALRLQEILETLILMESIDVCLDRGKLEEHRRTIDELRRNTAQILLQLPY